MKYAHSNACSWRETAEELAADARAFPPGPGRIGNVAASALESTHALHTSALWALVWLLTQE